MCKILIFLSLAISMLGNLSAQVTVTVNVPAAGGFSAALGASGGNKSTITNLVITGNIDARDVKFMRDSMPVLAVLDLAAVQILAYNGTGGTNSNITSYPKNKMPDNSFYSVYLGYGNSKTTLTSIFLPSTITSIGQLAFTGCIGLTEPIVIPNSVLAIESCAFSNCTGIKGTLKIPNSVTSIAVKAFGECRGLTGDLIIPNSVKTIDTEAFQSCYGLKGRLVLSNTLTTITRGAFQGCQFTGNLVLPSSIKTFEFDAFASCSGFTGDLIFPNSVTQIGDRSFGECTGFTACYIPNSVTSIVTSAFQGCKGFKKVAVNKVSPLTIDTSVFSYINKTTCELIVPIGSKTTYQAATGWKQFTNITEAIFVTLNTQGGNPAFPITTSVSNSTISEPNTPIREGYTFSGWYKEAACTNAWNFATDVVTAPITLYAKWGIATSINKVVNKTNLKIYPQPASNYIIVEGANFKYVSVIDLGGNKIPVGYQINENKARVDIGTLKSGAYIIRAEIDNGKTQNIKFIKK